MRATKELTKEDFKWVGKVLKKMKFEKKRGRKRITDLSISNRKKIYFQNKKQCNKLGYIPAGYGEYVCPKKNYLAWTTFVSGLKGSDKNRFMTYSVQIHPLIASYFELVHDTAILIMYDKMSEEDKNMLLKPLIDSGYEDADFYTFMLEPETFKETPVASLDNQTFYQSYRDKIAELNDMSDADFIATISKIRDNKFEGFFETTRVNSIHKKSIYLNFFLNVSYEGELTDGGYPHFILNEKGEEQAIKYFKQNGEVFSKTPIPIQQDWRNKVRELILK